jgi:hypothetical protein
MRHHDSISTYIILWQENAQGIIWAILKTSQAYIAYEALAKVSKKAFLS